MTKKRFPQLPKRLILREEYNLLWEENDTMLEVYPSTIEFFGEEKYLTLSLSQLETGGVVRVSMLLDRERVIQLKDKCVDFIKSTRVDE